MRMTTDGSDGLMGRWADGQMVALQKLSYLLKRSWFESCPEDLFGQTSQRLLLVSPLPVLSDGSSHTASNQARSDKMGSMRQGRTAVVTGETGFLRSR